MLYEVITLRVFIVFVINSQIQVKTFIAEFVICTLYLYGFIRNGNFPEILTEFLPYRLNVPWVKANDSNSYKISQIVKYFEAFIRRGNSLGIFSLKFTQTLVVIFYP